MKNVLSIFILLLLFIQPSVAMAQTSQCNPLNPANYQQCCVKSKDGGEIFCSAYRGLKEPNTDPCAGKTGAALTNCQNAQAAQTTLNKYRPSVNIGSGNSYGGSTISGVGGAIASCANVGNFLVNGASDLLGKTEIGKKLSAKYKTNSEDEAVPTADAAAKAQLKNMNRTQQCLNGVAYAAAKSVLAQMTNKTLKWVNTGMNGNPLYVQDVESYMKSIRNDELSKFLSGPATSDPIFGNAIRSVITQQVTDKTDNYLATLTGSKQYPYSYQNRYCPSDYQTLSARDYEACLKTGSAIEVCAQKSREKYEKLASRNCISGKAAQYNKFMGDFTQGGWGALLNSSNNPIGAMFTATDSISSKIATTQETTKAEVQRNNGFLDMKTCVEYEKEGQVGSGNGAGLKQESKCLQWRTDTPGSIIQNQLAVITNSPVRQLEYADNINEVLGKFFDNFINDLLAKGLRGTSRGVSEIRSTDASLNALLDSNGKSINGINSADLGYQSSTNGSGVSGDFDITRPQILRSILVAQYNFLNKSTDSQIALSRVIPTLGALDYCMPGPNPDWANGLTGNYQSFMGGLQQAREKDDNAVQTIIRNIPLGIGSFVGSIADGIKDLFGMDGPPPIFYAQTTLSDKVTDSGVPLERVWSDKDNKPDLGNVQNAFQDAMSRLVQQYQSSFDQSVIDNAFIAAATNDADKGYVHGFVQDAYNETSSLVNYNKTASELDYQYDQSIADTQNTVRQLELIKEEVDSIVSVAKSRYIKQRASQNNPVVMSCINAAYQINTTPINPQDVNGDGVADRRESTLPNPFVQRSIEASEYFYGTL